MTLLKEIQKERRDEEKYMISYWMTLRKGGGARN
jgi:hypothetical protein